MFKFVLFFVSKFSVLLKYLNTKNFFKAVQAAAPDFQLQLRTLPRQRAERRAQHHETRGRAVHRLEEFGQARSVGG